MGKFAEGATDIEIDLADALDRVGVLESDLYDLRDQFVSYLRDLNLENSVITEAPPAVADPGPQPSEPPVTVNESPAPAGGVMSISSPGSYTITEPVDTVVISSNDVSIRNEARVNVIRYGGNIANTEIHGGSVGSIIAEGLLLDKAYWHHMQMDGHVGGTAFNVGGSGLRLEAVNARVSRYGYYQWRGSGLHIRDCVFNSLLDDQEEASFRLMGVSNVDVQACEFESHTKYCVRAHQSCSNLSFVRNTLIGRWFQFGTPDGTDDIRGLKLEENAIHLDRDAFYMVLGRTQISGLTYIGNRHYDWEAYGGDVVERAYGDMIPNGWDIRGNRYL